MILREQQSVFLFEFGLALTSGAGKFLGIPGKQLGKRWEFFPGICWDS